MYFGHGSGNSTARKEFHDDGRIEDLLPARGGEVVSELTHTQLELSGLTIQQAFRLGENPRQAPSSVDPDTIQPMFGETVMKPRPDQSS